MHTNECASHDGDRVNKTSRKAMVIETTRRAITDLLYTIIMSDSNGTEPKESASDITTPAPATAAPAPPTAAPAPSNAAPAPLTVSPAPSTVSQSFTNNGTVNNCIMSEERNKCPNLSEHATASASAGASAAASASTGISDVASAHTQNSSRVSQSFTGNKIVNNTVNVVQVPDNQISHVNLTRDGKVYLPDKLPLQLKPNENKEELLAKWLFLLPFISTKSDIYPPDSLPQASEESLNDLQSVLHALHEQAMKVGGEVAEKKILDAFKTLLYQGRPPKSINEI